MMRIALCLLCATTAEAAPGDPDPPPVERKTPFDQFRFGLSLGAGSSTALGSRYFSVGAGAEFFVLDGLGVGLSGQHQWGDGPGITSVIPALRYVAQPLVWIWPVVPYAGVFYRHWFIADSYPDTDAIGTKGGLLYVAGSVVIGLGVVYERVVSECMMDCNAVYPDVTLIVAL